HAFTANVHPRESGGSRYVAGAVRNAGAPGCVGTVSIQCPSPTAASRSGGYRSTPEWLLVDAILLFVSAGVLGKGTNWVDAAADRRNCTNACSSNKICEPL